jgi:acyl-CoA reductase-like NAD-dependent aldehyde dehydrogenase
MAELPEPCLLEPRLLIGGELRGASDGGTVPIENPATGEEAGRAPDATDADVQDAIAAARRAFDETSWYGRTTAAAATTS